MEPPIHSIQKMNHGINNEGMLIMVTGQKIEIIYDDKGYERHRLLNADGSAATDWIKTDERFNTLGNDLETAKTKALKEIKEFVDGVQTYPIVFFSEYDEV